jgi:predicted nucleotidyltransferase
MRRNLSTVLNYFGYFLYAPSFDEIYTFFPKKIKKEDLKSFILKEIQVGKILQLSNNMYFGLFQSSTDRQSLISNHYIYTLPQYSIPERNKSKFKSQIKGKRIIRTVQIYLRILRTLPFVRFVGVTGSSAMGEIRKNDDYDLCIVTKHGLLWTTRFFTVIFAKLLRIHTHKGVCLNLFFDESDLEIPKNKHNLYIGHELIQMR